MRESGMQVGSALLALAVLFGVDKDGKVWQIDLSVPGHSCTIAASDAEAKGLLQEYQFDGARLTLRTKRAHPCETFAWAVDLAVPVFSAAGR